MILGTFLGSITLLSQDSKRLIQALAGYGEVRNVTT